MAERIAELAAVVDAAGDQAVIPPVGAIVRRAHRRTARRAGFGIAGVLVLAGAGVLAFQPGPHRETPPVVATSPSPSATPAVDATPPSAEPTSSPPSSPPSAGETTTKAVVTHCRAAQLSVSTRGAGAASSHSGLILVFRNTGSVACTLTGYPGVAVLDANDGQALQAQRTTSGYMGGAPVTKVTLAPNGSASALLEYTAMQNGGGDCVSYPALLVTAPDDTTSVRLAESVLGCNVQIHPVVSGTAGRL